MTYSAIVLAGSRPGTDPLAQSFGTDLKTLIPVGGEPMVVRPVRALLESVEIGKIIVLAQEPGRIAEVLPDSSRVAARQSQGTIAETLLAIVDTGELDWPLLVTTADHALLTSSMIDEFCEHARGVDIAIGVVRRRSLLRRLPETRRTWLKFRGGAYTGANLFAFATPTVRPAIELWRAVEQDRKKAWRVISVLGPLTMLLAGLRLISLDELLARLGVRLGLRLRAVRLSDPLAGVDVDNAADHALVEAIVEGKA